MTENTFTELLHRNVFFIAETLAKYFTIIYESVIANEARSAKLFDLPKI